MLKIKEPVGRFGRNQRHDVAVIQFMLKYFPRAKDGKPYYRGEINGQYGGQFTSAVANFHKDFLADNALPGKERDEIIKNYRLFTPSGGLYKWLAIWTSDNRFIKSGHVFSSTPVLYEAKPTSGERREARAYLIPDFLNLPRKFSIGGMTLDTRIDHVEFFEKPPGTFRFEVHLTLRGVGKFVHPFSLQQGFPAPEFVKAAFKKQLSGSGWSLGAKTLNGSHFSLVSRNVVEIGQATGAGSKFAVGIARLSGNSDVSRVYWDGLRKSYRIPPTDKILNIVGRIHAETCVSSGKDGGYVFNKPIAKYALTVLESALNKNLVAGQRRYCETCRELGDGIVTRLEYIETLWERRRSLDQGFQRFLVEETNQEAQKEAEDFAKKAGNNLIGVDVFQVEKTEKDQLYDSASSLAELYLEFNSRIGKNSRIAVKFLRVKSLIDGAIAIHAANELLLELAVAYLQRERVQKRRESYLLSKDNLWLEKQAEDVKVIAMTRDYVARKCTYWPS